MTFDVIVSGVGGQGVLSLAGIIAQAALQEGLSVKQSEVHGMSQRGGAVVANLRLASRPIASDLIPLGAASLVLSMEPLESLRYLRYLSPRGSVITAIAPVRNIPNYPDFDQVLRAIRTLPHAVLVDAEGAARKAGSARAANMVLVGAASRRLPIGAGAIERCIEQRFASKGPAIVAQNLEAFHAGQEAVA